MSQITGAGFASGAVGAGLNEALINAVKGKDPGTAQIVSAIIGAAAAKVAGGSAAAGASAAAAGTKWNLLRISDYNEMKRRTEEAKTDEERKAIEDEYKKKDKEQEEQEAAEAEELARQGIIPEAIILDILNKRYSPQYYVSFDGSPAPFRLPSTTVEGRLHSIFDLAGYLPFPVGSIASGADAGLFYKEGDHIAAGWAAASIIPFEKYFKTLKDLSKFEAFAKMTTRTSKIADRTVTIGGDVWEKGPFKRGDMIDDALGNNLGHNFPIIDKLENGVITSIKSIDLTEPSYQTAKGIYNKLRRDVDALDDFTIGTRKGIDVTLEDYSSKKLEIAIPDMKITAEQQRGLEMVKEYAKENGIETTITVVK